jgi:ABC-2 type transport system permease protein
MAGLGALSPDIKDARSTSIVILSPLILGYMMNIFIQNNPDGPLAVIVSLFPLTAPVTMIIRMTMTTVPVWQSVLAALLMVITAVLIIRAVSRLFRAQILLSGQAPSVRRYYRSLLGRA